MICHAFLIFSVLILAAVAAGQAPTPAYDPTDVFLINCGETSEMFDNNDRYWTGETKVLSSNAVNESFASYASDQTSGIPIVPYMTARISRQDFTYSFPVSPGWKFLRLYFYSTRYGFGIDAAGNSYSVTVNGFTLLKHFGPDLTANYFNNKFIIKEFIIPAWSGHTMLNLTFKPSPNSLAFVNGIEIVSMPDRFYSKGGFDNLITKVGGSTIDFEIDNSTAFETVYRVNMGGLMIDDVSDTGMFRLWLDDDEFRLSENPGIVPFVPGVKINYTENTPPYVAPEDVYTTYRTMENFENTSLNLNFNLTWIFPVDAGFHYLARLHFGETRPEVNRKGQCVFTIFIGNQTAKFDMDVIQLSGGSRIPVYLDFSVFVGFESGPRPDLRIDLHPYTVVVPKYYDAILNGVEILKLNLSDGNLAGPNPNAVTSEGESHVVMKTTRQKPIITITLIAVGSAIGLVSFIVLLIFLVWRQTKRMKNRQNNSVAMFKVLLIHYTYAEVKKITKSFSHTIGKGGFGTVYGGNLCNGRKVAVKVLKDSMGNGEDFINEVASMSQTSHINIVSLLGFCYEGSKRAIVYEFLENGSLDQFISRKKPLTLDVATLYGIALGVARGLEYLHNGCKTRIIHFDIKPQNILLDGNLCPKVSDLVLLNYVKKEKALCH